MSDPNKYICSVTEILPGLWLGNQASSQEPDFIKRVDVVINTTKHIPFLTKKTINIRIPVNDPGPIINAAENATMLRALLVIVPMIRIYRLQGKRILVHCHAGAQRSACVVAAYILKYRLSGMPARDKYNLVTRFLIKKRPIVFFGGLSNNFSVALMKYSLYT